MKTARENRVLSALGRGELAATMTFLNVTCVPAGALGPPAVAASSAPAFGSVCAAAGDTGVHLLILPKQTLENW